MITILQIIVSVILIAAILMQSKGTGLGSAWAGSGQSFSSKRGMETALFKLTVILTVIFLGLSILPLVGLA
jgi:protein translocase SecG subunit